MAASSKLARALVQASKAVACPPAENRRRLPSGFSTRRVAPPPGFSSALVRLSQRRYELPALVDPSTVTLLDKLNAVADQLTGPSAIDFVETVRRSSAERRNALARSRQRRKAQEQ